MKKILDFTIPESLGWKKLDEGVKPPVGLPWGFQIEGKATVVGPDGQLVSGDIASVDHVAAAKIENPVLGSHTYGISPAGWPQTYWDQYGGGVLTALYTVLEDHVMFGVVSMNRFLHVTGGQSDLLWDFPGRFVGAGNKPDEAIFEQLKGIKGLEKSKLTFPLPAYNDRAIPGTMSNRAFDLIVDDKQSNKVAALFIPPHQLKPNGNSNHRVLDVNYDSPMPPTSDTSREAEAKRKDIKFLTSVTKAEFVPWYELGLFGDDGIVLAQALRVLSAVRVGLLPTE